MIIGLTIRTTKSVPNFLSYVSAKYYLNWFAVGKVIIKITRGLAVANRPCDCCVGQFWPDITGR